MFEALAAAVLAKMHSSAAFFTPPTNSRGYGCKALGCERPAYARGLCNAHYIRDNKGLPMDVPVRARKRNDTCVRCGLQTGSKGGWGMCQRHYRQTRYEVLKDAAISMLGSRCAKCGGVFHRAVFDFHHHSDKTGAPSEMFLNKSIRYLAKELSKCSLLCANCHRMEHVYASMGDDLS